MAEGSSPLFPLLPELWGDPQARKGAVSRAVAKKTQGFPVLAEGFTLYLVSVEGKAATTAANYLASVEGFLRFVWEVLGREDLLFSRGDLLRYADELRARGAAESTVRYTVHALAAFARFLEWAGLAFPVLDLPPPRAVLRKARALGGEEFRSLLKLFDDYPSSWALPLEAAVVLMGDLGLTAKQAVRLAPRDVDLARGEVRLPGGFTPLSPFAAERLRRYGEWREGLGSVPAGFYRFLLSPKGAEVKPGHLNFHLRRFADYWGLSGFTATVLRLTGEDRLVRSYGLQEARRRLRRHLVR